MSLSSQSASMGRPVLVIILAFVIIIVLITVGFWVSQWYMAYRQQSLFATTAEVQCEFHAEIDLDTDHNLIDTTDTRQLSDDPPEWRVVGTAPDHEWTCTITWSTDEPSNDPDDFDIRMIYDPSLDE